MITENGKPAADFDGSDDVFGSVPITTSQPFSTFTVTKMGGTDSYVYDSSNRTILGEDPGPGESDQFGIYAGSWVAGSGFPYTSQSLHFSLYNGSSSVISTNSGSKELTGNAGGNSMGGDVSIGSRHGGYDHFLSGNIQELIIYDSDQSANRSGIESNINDYFSIY